MFVLFLTQEICEKDINVALQKIFCFKWLSNPDLHIDFNEEMFNQILYILEDEVLQMSGRNLEEVGVPRPTAYLMPQQRETSWEKL